MATHIPLETDSHLFSQTFNNKANGPHLVFYEPRLDPRSAPCEPCSIVAI